MIYWISESEVFDIITELCESFYEYCSLNDKPIPYDYCDLDDRPKHYRSYYYND